MRFPSVEALAGEAIRTFRRFPLPLVFGAVLAGLLMTLVDAGDATELRARGAIAAGLAVPLLIAWDVFCLRGDRARLRWILWGGTLAGLGGFFWASLDWGEDHLFTRFFQLLLAAHLLVAFLPFVRTKEENGFWQFNRVLFLRFALATLFAGVLFLGLVVAIASVNVLFDLSIDDLIYPRLWFFMAFVVHPWIFLAGVPHDIDALESDHTYPPFLKVFAQYVLLPLVAVYLLILTAYLVRVLVTQEWPSGWIGWLVSSVSAVGTLALLLVHPVRDQDENRWVHGYARWFWVALMPSIVMLFLAIGQRLAQYGFTENRYFLLVLANWIAIIAVAFAVTRSRYIRWIPVSLCVIALLTFFGPWGAYSVAERSQTNRLRALLAEAGVEDPMLAAGAATGASEEVEREVSAVLRYLFRSRGHAPVVAVLGEDAIRDHSEDSPARDAVDAHVMFAEADAEFAAEYLGLRYVSRGGITEEFVTVRAEPPVWPVPDGYEYSARLFLSAGGSQTMSVAGRELEWTLPDPGGLTVSVDGGVPVTIGLEAILRAAERVRVGGSQTVSLDPDMTTVEFVPSGVRVRLHFVDLTARVRDGGIFNPTYLQADAFLAFPEPSEP